MRLILALIALVCTIASQATESNASNQFVITGTTMAPYVIDGEPISNQSDNSQSDIRVVVTRDVLNAQGETDAKEIVEGEFQHGKVILEGEVEAPTSIRISVDADREQTSILDGAIWPGANISFVVLDYPAPNPVHLAFLGSSRRLTDPMKRFTISGDLRSIDADLGRTTIRIRASEYDDSGEKKYLNYGRVLLKDGKFEMEAEADEPRLVNILVVSGTEYTQMHAVIEPHAEISVVPRGSLLRDLRATRNGLGRHGRIVDAWQQSEEYVSEFLAYQLAYKEFVKESEEIEGNSHSYAVVEQDGEPEYLTHLRTTSRIRYDHLEQIASNADDPINRLLALELGAFSDDQVALAVYDEIAELVDRNLAVRRVMHARNNHALQLAREGNDRSLVIGQKAPNFTLPNIDGKNVSLSKLLEVNEYVLVDFWASWCGPCIAAFPGLKDLYASYRELGFEIVSVSLDDSHEDWSYSTEKHELPWINLGELRGFEGEIVTSYGVNFVPKGYLLDSDGQIVQKDLSTDQLKEFLGSVYGNPNE